MNVKKVTIAELEAAPNIKELLAEYAAESAIKDLPPPEADAEMYKAMEARGMLSTFAAYNDDDLLIGYVTVLSTRLPHYSRVISVSESIFVSAPYRHTGAGTVLRIMAESEAHDKGSPGLLCNAPVGSDFAKVLPRVGYEQVGCVFYKKVGR